MGSFQSSAIKIFVSAGEPSGDLHGSNLVRSIKGLCPGARVACMGGPLLEEAGASVLVDNRDLAVVGISEVLRHSKVIYRGLRRIREHLARERPQIVVLIDFPDFNLLLARYARKLGIKVFYYITPQVWAWRSGRVRTLRRLVDRLAVILPFESEFFKSRNMEVDFVGHPLLDVLDGAPGRDAAVEKYRSDRNSPLVGLLPGSRHGEIRSLLPVLFETASVLHERLPGISFILPAVPSVDRLAVEREAARRRLRIQIVQGDTYGVIRASDLIVAASGTVTLEAAVLGTPMIIIYKVSKLTALIGRRLIRIGNVGLPNLIAGKTIVPELLQNEVNPSRIASEVLGYLQRPERLEAQRKELAAVRSRLGKAGVAERVARMVLSEIWSPAESSPPPTLDSTAARCSTSDRLPSTFNLLSGAVMAVGWPLLLGYYLLRGHTDGKYRHSFLDRLGLNLPKALPPKPRVWFHALSVGETISAVPLVRALRKARPDVQIVFSTATEAGRAVAQERLGDLVEVCFHLPHDLPWINSLLVKRVNPKAFVLVETDIWPNLLDTLKRNGVQRVLVNGRLSEKSFIRLQRFKGFVGPIFRQLDSIFVQSPEDRRRYQELGVPLHGIHASGNLKFDSLPSRVEGAALLDMRRLCGIAPERPVWIAGSTHEGEEKIVLEVHRGLLRKYPELLLIIAPRQVRRTAEITSLCDRLGLPWSARSTEGSAEGRAVFLLDTIGELGRFYALADIAFVGGSLAPFGGHNPLEPLGQGKPTFWGPHMFNFRHIEDELLRSGCGRRIHSRDELLDVLDELLRHEDVRKNAGEAAKDFLALHRGSSQRIAGFLVESMNTEARHTVQRK